MGFIAFVSRVGLRRLMAGGKFRRHVQDVAGRFKPVLGKGGLQADHHIPAHPAHHVAPGRQSIVVSIGPVGGNPCPADKGDFSINHQKLAVSAVVDALEGVPSQRLIPRDKAPGFAEFIEIAIGAGETSKPIKHQFHADARFGALG